MIDKRRDAFWRGKPDDGKKAPAGRLMPGADGLMPVKGSDAASDDSSRRPCFLIFYQRKIKFSVDNNI